MAVFQTCQAFFEESFPPAADDLTSSAKAIGNLLVRQTLLSEEDHLGASDSKIRQRILIGAPFQLVTFLLGEEDFVRAIAWQNSALPAPA
jgi:hypothetical protein